MHSFCDRVNEYAPFMRWRWSGELQLELLQAQLRSMQRADFGGAVIHTAHDASPSFNGEGWLDLAGRVLETARELKLRIWIGCAWSEGPTASFAHCHIEELPPHDLDKWSAPARDNMLLTVAAPVRGVAGTPEFAESVVLAPGELPPGHWREGARVWQWSRREYSAVDALHPQSARNWIERVGERIGNSLGRYAEYSGGAWAGFQLEHPSLWPSAACPDGNCFPWSSALPAGATSHLMALIADTGATATRSRQQFWSAISALQASNWRALEEWAQGCGVEIVCALTGECDTMHATVLHYGDAEALLNVVSQVAVDADGSSPLAHLAASVAELRGSLQVRGQLRSDNAGATPSSRLSNLHHWMRRGVTSFAFHAEYSRLGGRGQSQLHQPYFDVAGEFSRYLARCGSALAQGRPGARVGVLWPGRSLLAHYHPHGHRLARWVSEDFAYVTQLLDELHYDFVLLPEAMLSAAQCEAELLLCGPAQLPLEMIVVAGATTLSRAAWIKLEEFVANGGKVACFGMLPRWSELGRDVEWEERINKTTLTTLADSYEHEAGQRLAAETYPVFHEHRSGGRLCCFQPLRSNDREDARRRVHQILRESISADLETQSSALRYCRRVRGEGDGEIMFVENRAESAQQVRLRVLAPDDEQRSPHRFDAWTGVVKPIPVWMSLQGREAASITHGVSFSVELAAHEAVLLWMSPQQASAYQASAYVERANCVVEEVTVGRACGYAREDGAPSVAVKVGGRLQWRSAAPVQLPAPILLASEWSAMRLAPNVWRSERFIREDGVRSLYLAAPRSTINTKNIRLNDEKLLECAPPFAAIPLWNDDRWQWFDLQSSPVGEISLSAAEGVLSAMFIVGEFEMDDEFGLAEIPHLVEPQSLLLGEGSWHDQGLSHYSGKIEYARSVAIPASWADCRVFLELARARDAVEATVNGVTCGVRLSAPYRWDVTDCLYLDAVCEVRLRFANTTSPLEDETPAAAGLLGPARLVAYPRFAIELAGGA